MERQQVEFELSQPAISADCPERVDQLVTCHADPYSAAAGGRLRHPTRLRVCTRWQNVYWWLKLLKNLPYPPWQCYGSGSVLICIIVPLFQKVPS